MARTYGEKFLIELHKGNPEDTGTALGLACVKANLPAKYVAPVLGVTRMTVYGWFRNKPISAANRLKVETFTDLVESDTAKGILPARNMYAAKLYIDAMMAPVSAPEEPQAEPQEPQAEPQQEVSTAE